MDKPILKLLANHPVARKPVWLMRQAGRYLPEYRRTRSQAKNFLDLCLSPKLATEVTMQPIRRFGFDAAIVFADILLIPHALGQNLAFKEGEGPVLDPISDQTRLASLQYQPNLLTPVYETISALQTALPQNCGLIGFAGAPWTVSCYMIDGRGKTGFPQTLSVAKHHPQFLQNILSILISATTDYLLNQIRAGAEIIQLFDSWANLIPSDDETLYENAILKPTRQLIQNIRQHYPHIPIIGFPRAVSPQRYLSYAKHTGITALSIDEKLPLDFIRDELQKICIVQGALDPQILVQGGKEMRLKTQDYIHTLKPNHIFNLGHGIVPETPPENVAALIDLVRYAEKPT